MGEPFQYVLCPYCGQAQANTTKCAACGGLFEPLSRKATQISMGPWYIRDKRMPFRPGCSYEILKKQIQAGKVKATTVLRGPTTRQFWSVARNTPGVAHLLGYCHACGAAVRPDEKSCSKCKAKFDDVHQRNELGLMFPTEASAAAAQKAMEQQIESGFNTLAPGVKPPPAPGAGDTLAAPAQGAQPDLLNEVLAMASRRQGKGPGQAGEVQALDFAPGEESLTPVVLQPANRMNAVTWLLILLVAFLTIMLVTAVWYITQTPAAGPTAAPPPAAAPATPPATPQA